MVLAEETTDFGTSQDHAEPSDKDGFEGSHIDTRFQLRRFYKTVGLVLNILRLMWKV